MKLIWLISLLLFVSCAVPSISPSAEFKVFNALEVESILAQQDFTCASKEACSNGVGKIMAFGSDKKIPTKVCTGFLVSDDLVLTNSHCLWLGRISLEKTCENTFFSYQNNAGNGEIIECAEILFRDSRQTGAASYRNGDKDFALIRLARSLPEQSLQISQRKITKDASLKAIVYDHFSLSFAIQQTVTCRWESTNKLGVMKLTGCPIIRGNSGSPIVNHIIWPEGR